MTNHLLKISQILFSLVFSLLIISCSDGGNSFVPAPEEPVEEVEDNILITGGAVKGPLINAEINIYKFDLDTGPIRDYNLALNTWINLLEQNEVQINDGGYTTSSSLHQTIQNLQSAANEFGYVSELKGLKSKIQESTDFSAGAQLVEDYKSTKETNTLVINELDKALSSSATINELQRKIEDIESLTDKLIETETIASAKSLLNSYQANESDQVKKDGFAKVIEAINSLSAQASNYSLSKIRQDYKNTITDVFLKDFILQNDPIARQNILNYEEELSNSLSLKDAKSILDKFYRKEGNSSVKAAIAKIKSNIITVDKVHNLIIGHEAFYHDFSIKTQLLLISDTPATADDFSDSLSSFYETVFASNFETAFRDSLVILNDDGDPTNRLSFGVSNNQGLLPNLAVNDYRGFIYMNSISTNRTIDLNSGKKPFINELETIFHTDDILGNGDNSLENRINYFLLNGEEQRNVDGDFVTDKSLIETVPGDELIEVKPSFFTTPLTKLSIDLAINKLKSLDYFLKDSDEDLNADKLISESLFKTALKESSSDISAAFGIGTSKSIFLSSPVRLAEMKYSSEDELETIQYRLSVENFSSFLYDIHQLTNAPVADIFKLLAKDLSDGQIDGFYKNESVDTLSDIPQLEYLLGIDPTERTIPDTQKKVSEIFFLMNDQQADILPEHSINLYQSAYNDLVIQAVAGGVDSDGDGILDNQDQFPNDPLKTRDINSGYAGIWSLNYDNSESEYMPFNRSFNFQLSTELNEGACANEPCISVGDLATPIIDTFTLISGPTNNDFLLTEPDDNSIVGFTAFATVPGEYLLKAEFSSSVSPVQTYSTIIPITVIDPKKIEIRFEPEKPVPGESVSVQFKATKAICSLYTICSGINLDDNIDDYLDLSLLSDVFSVKQSIERSNNTSQYTSVESKGSVNDNAKLSNIELNDALSVLVSFTAQNRDFVTSSYTHTVGETEDNDSDGVFDTLDVYPNDPNCSVEKDGLLDTNFDGEFNNLDTPFCFASITDQATVSFDVNFLNETWYYNADWHFIIRKNKFENSFNGFIKTPTLTGTKSEIIEFKEDPTSKRIYFAYLNGDIDYYAFEQQSILAFTQADTFSSISSLNLIGSFLLVETLNVNSITEVSLYNPDGLIADISGTESYPFPGNAITLSIDDQNFKSATDNQLQILWTLERESSDKTVSQIPVQTANDDQTLISGQTVYGDVLKVTLSFTTPDDRVIQFDRNIYILGVNSIAFDNKDHDPEVALKLDLVGFDSSQISENNTSLFVKWFKNDVTTSDYVFVLSDLKYPFIFEANNFIFGDMVKAEVYLKHGVDELLVTEAEAVILGEVDRLFPVIDTSQSTINIASREVFFAISKPSQNDEYFNSSSFKPIWKINDQPIPNENNLYFPSLDSSTLKYGDVLTVSYSYNINGLKSETDDTFVIRLDPDISQSIYELSSKVLPLGEDISISANSFTEEELLKYEPRWRINGVIDESVTEFTYSADKLFYGDFVELLILPKENTIEAAFDNIATASVGINLDSLQNSTTDPLLDLDSDNDGVPNHQDYFRNDNQCSSISQGNPDDIDGDGINDLDELTLSSPTNPNLSDSDGDGLNDYDELYVHFTDPNNIDSDGDGYSDKVEIDLNTLANDASSPNAIVADNDFDGLSNEEEILNKTKVNVFDTDNDGLSDWYEIYTSLTDPLVADTDGDYLSDGLEVKIILTDPNNIDSDSDGLEDGQEVLLGLDPTNTDSDGDSISDPDEADFDFSQTLSVILYESDLPNYDANFSSLLSVLQGTCFKTWLANNDADIISFSNEQQIDSSSTQELVFSSPSWKEIIRYDAQNEQFISSIDSEREGENLTAIEFDSDTPTSIYLGYSDGLIRVFDGTDSSITDLFTGVEGIAITKVLDQGSILLVEQKTADDNYIHSFFDLSDIGSSAKSTSTVGYSYANAIWSNNSKTNLLIVDTEFSETSFIEEIFDPSAINPLVSNDVLDIGVELNVPLFTENLESKELLRFGNGVVYNLSDDVLISDLIAPFSAGFQHQNHRVAALNNSSFLQITTSTNIVADRFWRLNAQLEHPDLLSLIPVGYHLLAISKEMPDKQTASSGKISFQKILLGDENANGLPEWWENLSDAANLTSFNAYELSTDAQIPDYLDGQPDIDDSVAAPTLVDSDSDGICDHWETNLFGTDPELADSDSDGMSDAQELGITVSLPVDCSIFPQYSFISDPLDSDSDNDGLLDGAEYFTHNTNPLLSDTDGDGLTDQQEITITFTDPNDSETVNGVIDGSTDSDLDGLTDSFEINFSKTDYLNSDSDSDTICDSTELNITADPKPAGIVTGCLEDNLYGTNPLNPDTDGDTLTDSQEINLYQTDPGSIDSDQDGLTDYVELNIGSVNLYASNPNEVDSDLDGLDDLAEFNVAFEYSEDLLEVLNSKGITPNLKSKPMSTDPLFPEASKDTDGDGICDKWEVLEFGSNPAEADSDFDGLNDADELGIDTSAGVDCDNLPESLPISNFIDRDTDDDGILDGDEVNILFTLPNDRDSNDNGIKDGDEDPDSDRLTNAQELYITLTNPFLADSDGNGITDDLEHFDNDNLNNFQEVEKGTDPYKEDTDEDGILDSEDDSPILNDADNDGLIDGDEENIYDTDPNNPDSDGDGLNDGEEINVYRTDPKNPDSDFDFLLDGEDLFKLNSDADSDGIPDGIEVHYLRTDPNKLDTDGDGLEDGYEAWVFAFQTDSSGQNETETFVKVGTEDLSSKKDINLWPAPVKFSANSLDRSVEPLRDPLDQTIIKGNLYIQRYSNPNKQDSDEDGLTDTTEFLIEANYGTEYHPELTPTSTGQVFSPILDNETNFRVSDPWDINTNNSENAVNDGDEDIDNDSYKNILDQNNNGTSVVVADSDGDGLSDGLEVLILGTDPFMSDTDLDGLLDQTEVKSSIKREVLSSEACLDNEVRVSEVGGQDFCFEVEYNSYPTLQDSDNDGVADRSVNESDNSVVIDNFPLDASCHLASDGFIKADSTIQCFSSWMAEQTEITTIKNITWLDTSAVLHSEILFFSPGWDKLIRYDVLNEYYESAILNTETIVDMTSDPESNLLYLINASSDILTFNLETNVLSTLKNIALADHTPQAIKFISSDRMLVQFSSDLDSRFSYSLIDTTPSSAIQSLTSIELDLKESAIYCDVSTCDAAVILFGFIKDSTNNILNVSSLELNLSTDQFVLPVIESDTLEATDDIFGPIHLNEQGDKVLLGSGQILELSLQGSDESKTLDISYFGNLYSSYFDFAEFADHFVGVVDFDVTGIPGSEETSETQNALLVVERDSIRETLQTRLGSSESLDDLKVLNQYLLRPTFISDKVLKVIPFADTTIFEVAIIKKSDGAIKIENLGLADSDNDLMSNLYENVYLLNDSDITDKFLDVDSDGLANVEEFFFATDPNKEDTDDDGWFDIDEILNGTDPRNILSF